jgi:hypothetical protein
MDKTLLSEIVAFLADHPMTDYKFGIQAAHNGRLLERLRSGGRVWPEQEQRIRDFIKSESARRSKDKAA